jgi:hypothetical protein
MSERSLAHIEEIGNIFPIEGADKIEAVQVLGWVCVALKNEFKVGDRCIYIEIDSICPELPVFEFLRDRKFRVRTIKLRKQISQGLALPINDNMKQILKKDKFNLGEDVTELLGITKYESESDAESTSKVYRNNNQQWLLTRIMFRFQWFRTLYHFIFGKKSKGFPEWIQKTDEDRIQNNPAFYLGTKGPAYISEKLDGQSGTYFIKKSKGFMGFGKLDIGMCSRNIRKGENSEGSWADIWRRLSMKQKLKDMLEHFNNLGYDCQGVSIQGEIIGPTIQGNKYQRTENEFYLFRAMWLDSKGVTTYLNLEELLNLAKRHGLNTVPILDKDFKVWATLEEALAFAEAKSAIIKTPVEREGIVFRTHDQKVSYKVISNKFLLKHKDEDEANQAQFKKNLDEKSLKNNAK